MNISTSSYFNQQANIDPSDLAMSACTMPESNSVNGVSPPPKGGAVLGLTIGIYALGAITLCLLFVGNRK